jgi:hypothetical protein
MGFERWGIVRAFDEVTFLAEVELTGFASTKLEGVPVAYHCRGDLPVDGTRCVVLFHDDFDQSDAVIIALYGGRPGDDPAMDPVTGHLHSGRLRDGGVLAEKEHGELVGLGGDDHTQYLLGSGARAMTGKLDLGWFGVTKMYSNILTVHAGGDGDYATIAAAAAGAVSGDTILVYPGTYDGKFTIPAGVNLVGIDAGSCVITYADTNVLDRGPLWTFSGNSYVSNLRFGDGTTTTIKGGTYECIRCLGTGAWAEIVFNNVTLDWQQGAMAVSTQYYGIRNYGVTSGVLKIYGSRFVVIGYAANRTCVDSAICNESSYYAYYILNSSVYVRTYTSGDARCIEARSGLGHSFLGTTVGAYAAGGDGRYARALHEWAYVAWVQEDIIVKAGYLSPTGYAYPNWAQGQGQTYFITGYTGGYAMATFGKTELAADAATTVPAVVKGAASQSANLQEWRDSTGAVLLKVHPDGDVELPAGKNLVLATATGTKIGTGTDQLLGFYNATPVNQPETVGDAATEDLTGGDTMDRVKTEADLASCKAAINAVIDRLQELGLIA